MRPNVTTQIQRTKGVRQPVDDAARADQEIARGIVAGIAVQVPVVGQLDVTTSEAEAPIWEEEPMDARILMAKAVSEARHTVRNNGDGTYTHSYTFECAV